MGQDRLLFKLRFQTILLISLLIGCSGDMVGVNSDTGGSASVHKIQLSGSSTIGPLADEIGKRYETLKPNVRVDVQTGGSSRGIADTESGLADVGMSSRPLKNSEKPGRKAWPIAMDGVCFIVNAENPVKELSATQITSVLMGEIENWNQCGGRDEPIVMINRAAGRSELELVTKFFGITADKIKADLIASENQEGIKLVASRINSISYMSIGASEDAVSRGTTIKLLPLDGIEATVANVESNIFPLSRPLIFVTKSEPSNAVREFINYAQSDKVQDLVRELSYVPISN